ncbi:NAC domain-containing protein 21/22 [Sesamum alatum]|uniref:NAC domain-containing protein 21/22 n=1 Tax=Sesamum alatum TaxID=300844 RepID=A0AAE1XYX8_9LAMI|nr:NAC domain-containing protein 21/22 [Sesamum alatum]
MHAQEDWVLCRVFHKNRSTTEVAPKQEKAGSRYEKITTSSSPSLPPLMEPYVAFDHNDQYHHHQQVPCFSIFSPNQTALTFSLIDPAGSEISPPPPPPPPPPRPRPE